jgi:hypothetical protein
MTDTGFTADEETGTLQRGLDALAAAQTAREMNEALDLDALAGEVTGDSVDVDHLGDAIGRPLGRLVARELIDGSGATGVTKQTIGSAVTRRVTAETVRLVVENVDTEALAETLVELDQETPGPSLTDGIDTGAGTESRLN